ncbi:hypothetical protein HanRHA438_Chr01g0040131 [Helianthus annuus]|uniref:Uncharacterized protein n=1 Tax=Helianthus annuus TaxID=4232 RepID=A0A251VRZ0_HELAN|nr:uncharacterized protein LOC110881049 [Helianthus annuus]KAF5823524.1 hypothetical protein HanXRQr2_Chr01g0039271 [Helianthus annuus]KAJ0949573.1 hypothetical protein HanRHA438_Chr01g0040131 [Helianthus annuus]KAJ0958361.1 hypothetical protein HanPSC8_Chr01g0038101 [Helianthus annuus]
MADDSETPKVKDSPSVSQSYLEVNCTSSSKIRRFSAGTEAGFALHLINKKLDDGLPVASYIEAVKEGEEPVSFGRNSVLVCYGHGWKLQTVTEPEGARARGRIRRTINHESSPLFSDELHSTKSLLPSVIGVHYIAKVLLAFVLLFVFGAVFTLALENLPRLLIFINPSV